MSYAVAIEDIQLPLAGGAGHEWALIPGLEAPLQRWEVPRAIAQQVIQRFLAKEVTLTLGAVKIQRVIVLGNASANDPNHELIVMADVRWYWTRAWFVRDFNVRRRANDTRLVGEVPRPAQILVNDVVYAPQSLRGPNTAWQHRPLLEHALDYASRAVHGPATIQWTIDPASSRGGDDRIVEETLADDELPTGLARAVGAIAGRSICPDEAGVIHVIDATLGAEIPLISSLNPDGALLGHGHMVKLDMRASRSKTYRVLFTPEYEVKCTFREEGTVEENEPFLTNVIRLPDKQLQVGDRLVNEGTYLQIESALFTGWGAPTSAGPPVGALTFPIIRKHFLGRGLEMNYVQRFSAEPDPVWHLRIAGIKGSYRVLFQVNPRFWASVRSARANRVAVEDTENGQRAPSPVFAQHAVRPSIRWLVANVLKLGYSAKTYAKTTTDLRSTDNLPACASLRMVDEELGIFLVEWKLPGDGSATAIAPSALEDEPTLDPNNPYGIPFTWPRRKLSSSHELAFIISCVPAAPNSDKRLFEVPVTIGEAGETLGVGASLEALGPDKVLRCRLTNARFAWSDDPDTRDRILAAFGGQRGVSVSATDPSLTVESLRPVNRESELIPAARAQAARELAGLLDHYEGSLAIPLTPGIRPIGSLQRVTHRVARTGETSVESLTILQASGHYLPPDPVALLPAYARRTIRNEVQP